MDVGVRDGHVVAVGEPPAELEVERVEGTPVRFEGADGRVQALVVRDANGDEQRHVGDTVPLGLGLHPRDALLRMGRDLPVRVVGVRSRWPTRALSAYF